MKPRNNLPHIQSKQALSWARWKEEYIIAKLWINIIKDDIFEYIMDSDDNWTDLSKLIKPSQINVFWDSGFQNSELESLSSLIIEKLINAWDNFVEIDVNEYFADWLFQLNYLIENGYLKETSKWHFIVVNKFIKEFFKKWIFNLDKVEDKIRTENEFKIKRLEEEKMYIDILDKVMYIYTYINFLSIDEFENFDWFKVLIEYLTDDYLTLKSFDWEERWLWDIFIWVKWVTFESDPLKSNIFVWYLEWRSEKSIEEALGIFISWIKTTPKDKFEEQVKINLNIYDWN